MIKGDIRMFCNECGNECDDDAVFCDKCGTSFNYGTRLVSYEEGAFTSSYIFKDITFDDLTNRIHDIFMERGYKLKKGEIGNAVYDRGSATFSFLTRGLSDRNVFKVNIYPESDNMYLKIKMPMFKGGVNSGLEFNDIKKIIKSI
jgi:hypothetical protein